MSWFLYFWSDLYLKQKQSVCLLKSEGPICILIKCCHLVVNRSVCTTISHIYYITLFWVSGEGLQGRLWQEIEVSLILLKTLCMRWVIKHWVIIILFKVWLFKKLIHGKHISRCIIPFTVGVNNKTSSLVGLSRT